MKVALLQFQSVTEFFHIAILDLQTLRMQAAHVRDRRAQCKL